MIVSKSSIECDWKDGDRIDILQWWTSTKVKVYCNNGWDSELLMGMGEWYNSEDMLSDNE